MNIKHGILNVVQSQDWARIELEDGFYIALNSDGMIVGKEDPAGVQDPHAHIDPHGADQIARSIWAWRTRFSE